MAVILTTPNIGFSNTSPQVFSYVVPANCCVILSKANFTVSILQGVGCQGVISLVVNGAQEFYAAPYVNQTGGQTAATPYEYTVDFGPNGLIVGPGQTIQVTLQNNAAPSGSILQLGFIIHGDLLNG